MGGSYESHPSAPPPPTRRGDTHDPTRRGQGEEAPGPGGRHWQNVFLNLSVFCSFQPRPSSRRVPSGKAVPVDGACAGAPPAGAGNLGTRACGEQQTRPAPAGRPPRGAGPLSHRAPVRLPEAGQMERSWGAQDLVSFPLKMLGPRSQGQVSGFTVHPGRVLGWRSP